MDALVLCGGYATRLEPITLFVPKPLLPVGGKPIIDYIVEDIAKLSPNKFIFSTNSKFADQFLYWIGHRKVTKLRNHKIEVVVEPTVNNNEKFGAIKGINYTIEKAGLDDDLLIVAGDNFYKFSLDRLLESFNRTRKPTIAVYDVKTKEEAKKFGVVTMQGDKITSFEEKPENPSSTLVSTAIYLLPKETLKRYAEYVKDGNNPDAPGYFLQWLIKRETINGVVYDDLWYDIGTVDTYKKVFDAYVRK